MGCSLAFVWDLVALTPHPPQSLLKLRDLSTTQLCSYLDVPAEDFANQIALVARGNCTFYEKVRLAQGSGAHGLLIVSKEKLVGCSGLPHAERHCSDCWRHRSMRSWLQSWG